MSRLSNECKQALKIGCDENARTCAVWCLLQARPYTSKELSRLLDVHMDIIQSCIKHLRDNKLAHICGYNPPPNGNGQWVAKYAAGDAPDKPMPYTDPRRKGAAYRMTNYYMEKYRLRKNIRPSVYGLLMAFARKPVLYYDEMLDALRTPVTQNGKVRLHSNLKRVGLFHIIGWDSRRPQYALGDAPDAPKPAVVAKREPLLPNGAADPFDFWMRPTNNAGGDDENG